ncbi:MAG: hypothetical protein L0387_36015 [Acidobacteria bacterium]|nr:hypothetical protein [Acidobacteriota bacterium]
MATYRVGNAYLSEADYTQHVDQQVALLLFVAGLVGGCFGAYWAFDYLHPAALAKWTKFTIVIVAGISSGWALARVRNIVRVAVGSLFLCAFLVAAACLIWKFV